MGLKGPIHTYISIGHEKKFVVLKSDRSRGVLSRGGETPKVPLPPGFESSNLIVRRGISLFIL